ncbi:alpha/beta hydrolase [Actinomadura parmotrematis]|uniref:Acyl-CoA:diacylglycerol acyltransferase n=1 Tax=Actinomadura parmotrematis TaxID=2864039 RepID=A0ABS7FRM4_9ACTN|nr:alpha/beta hydrolase family protein [Actinomadura parmotrematis]MBW8482379.1 esterase family protein [Actinomadura parmotrematis]
MTPSSRRRRTTAVALGSAAAAGLSLVAAAPSQAAAFRKADDGAAITATKWLNSAKTEFDFTVKSPALGTSAKVRVLVPKGWKYGASKSYPVLYALHGGKDTYVSWTRSTDIEQVAAKYNAIVVMPEGANGSYTNWYNYGKGGTPRWEDFHLREVRQLVERNYQAGASRAVMGLSSGAQGACSYPGRAPGTFKYAACFSGVLSMSSPGIPALLMYTNVSEASQDPFAIWGVPRVDQANWDAHDPIKLLPKMTNVKFYISAGTSGQRGPLDDPSKAPWDIGYLSEPPIGATNKEFLARAQQLGIKIQSHIYTDGSHTWPYWQREMHTAYPSIMAAIGAKKV